MFKPAQNKSKEINFNVYPYWMWTSTEGFADSAWRWTGSGWVNAYKYSCYTCCAVCALNKLSLK